MRFRKGIAYAVMGMIVLVANVRSSQTTYDGSKARDASIYASAAYCPPYRVRNWTMVNEPCKSSTEVFEIKNVYDLMEKKERAFAFIGVDHEREWIVAAFKGTNATLADVIRDLEGGEFMTSSCTSSSGLKFPGRVHSGFCEYYNYFVGNNFVEDYVSVAKTYPFYDNVLTGHSLGAAAALLAAYEIERTDADLKCSVFAIGQPRVGNYDFAQGVYENVENLYRIVHKADIVAHLPIVRHERATRTYSRVLLSS